MASPLAGKRVNSRHRLALQAAVVFACGALVVGGVSNFSTGILQAATPREAPILPTVHPTLLPASAIPVSVIVHGERTSVWKADLEQRMLVTGHVRIDIGYRSLRADNAAIWLTPSKEAGESTWDVAIYLSGEVHLLEGGRASSTATSATELLVTTRISRTIQLESTPSSKVEEENPIVRRGDSLRQDLLNRPAPMIHIPEITITSTEAALQAGWIAKGPNNRIVAGPGDFQLARGPDGRLIPVSPNAPKPPKPRPQLFIAIPSDGGIREQQIGNEMVTVITNPYLIYDALDGKPAIEFHAQRMVTFSPVQKTATTSPAGAAKQPGANMTRFVTGAYMEGDVTLNSGEDMTVHADRIYYDFTSQRAVMLDANLYTVDQVRNVPIYLRATQIRQLARGEYAAKNASFSTSEFHTPHYNIGAGNVYLQDITPHDESPAGAGQTYEAKNDSAIGPRTYAFKAKNATIDVGGVPIFYWPYLSGDTSQGDIPLRRLEISDSKTYGLSLRTDWNIFSLAGQKEPKNFHADLELDEFSRRGPAGGVNATWNNDDSRGFLRSYGLVDRGNDNLGANRQNVDVTENDRGRLIVRHQQDLGDGWSMNLEGSYISDPNFLQQFFPDEFSGDKEHENSFYLKHQGDTDAISFLAKFNLLDFTTVADQVDDQFTTEKRPEAKYWRTGDSFLDLFTYYSESGIANLHTDITNFTPAELSLIPSTAFPNFVGAPGVFLPLDAMHTSAAFPTATSTYRDYYLNRAKFQFTNDDVLRGDTRQELDMPLLLGDLKVTPYITGRVTAWDNSFAEDHSGNTTRLWGSGGIRSSMEFWRVYNDVNSTFWDIHEIRHIIEPQFNIFASGSDENRANLQPFDRDVEGISKASGASLALDQKWQTKRGGPGHWRNVDWLTLNIQYNNFWSKDNEISSFYPYTALRGFYFASRPELSLIRDSVAIDGTWRIGERVRFLGEMNYDTQSHQLEQFATGIAINQTDALSYFIGNRYVQIPSISTREIPGFTGTTATIPGYNTNEVTAAIDYQLTRKYEITASESYDTSLRRNILSSITIFRKLPRFTIGISATYDADNKDTTFGFSAAPEGIPELSVGNGAASRLSGR